MNFRSFFANKHFNYKFNPVIGGDLFSYSAANSSVPVFDGQLQRRQCQEFKIVLLTSSRNFNVLGNVELDDSIKSVSYPSIIEHA